MVGHWYAALGMSDARTFNLQGALQSSISVPFLRYFVCLLWVVDLPTWLSVTSSSIFIYLFWVSIHFCSWTDIQPFFFFFWVSWTDMQHATSFFFLFGVRPLLFMGEHATIFFFFFRCPSTFVHGRTCNHLVFFFGRGLVEVTKCYLVTLLVVHLGSWTCWGD